MSDTNEMPAPERKPYGPQLLDRGPDAVTLRDVFALSYRLLVFEEHHVRQHPERDQARVSAEIKYRHADAMLVQRGK